MRLRGVVISGHNGAATTTKTSRRVVPCESQASWGLPSPGCLLGAQRGKQSPAVYCSWHRTLMGFFQSIGRPVSGQSRRVAAGLDLNLHMERVSLSNELLITNMVVQYYDTWTTLSN